MSEKLTESPTKITKLHLFHGPLTEIAKDVSPEMKNRGTTIGGHFQASVQNH